MRRTPPSAWAFGLLAFAVTCIGGYFLASLFIHKPSTGNLGYIHKEDPELQVAIETARRSLSELRQALAKPDPDVKSLAVKMRLASPDSTIGPEYLWVDHLQASGNDFKGILHDEPVLDKNLHKGDPITVKEEDVVDWLILHNNDQHDGGFTDEVLRKRQP